MMSSFKGFEGEPTAALFFLSVRKFESQKLPGEARFYVKSEMCDARFCPNSAAFEEKTSPKYDRKGP